MPRIPTYEAGRGASGATGNLSPAAYVAVGNRVASDLDRLALIRQRIAEEDQRQKNALLLSRATILSDRALYELRDQALSDPDYVGAPQRFREGSAALLEGLSQQITDDQDRAEFELSFMRRADSVGLAISNDSRQRIAGERVASLGVMEQEAARAYAKLVPGDPSDEAARAVIRDDVIGHFNRAQSDGLINDAPKRIEAFKALLDENDALGAINYDPVDAFSGLQAGSGRYANLPESKRLRLAAQAEKAIAAEARHEETERRLARADLRDRSAEKRKAAILRIESPDEDYGYADLEADAPDLTPADMSAVVSAMKGGGTTNTETARSIRRATTAPGATFDEIEDLIGDAEANGALSPADAERAYSLNLKMNGDQVDRSLKEGYALIDEAIAPSPFDFGDKSPAALRAEAAKQSLDDFVAELPETVVGQQRDKAISDHARELVRRASNSAVTDQSLLAPYSFGSKDAFRASADQRSAILEAKTKLEADAASGSISPVRFQTELANLLAWKKIVEAQSAQQGETQ